jgi:hypothetical protein
MPRWRPITALPCCRRGLIDRAKVEACVLIVERWLIGRLRNRVFYSLAELNAAIGDLDFAFTSFHRQLEGGSTVELWREHDEVH